MGNVKEVILDCSLPNAEYADPHILEASRGDIVKFTARNSAFEVLIHNKNGFFDSDAIQLEYFIGDGSSKQTPPISSNLAEGNQKYYSANCLEDNVDADKVDGSPPKIIIIVNR
ncbi:MAG: hypothetical protein DRQ01_02910 [Ignavibacteriae bacterium]|nr:MAG: hypothetical protein DRQ01_02910 [Ignavibacteriota bacterium]